MSKEFYLRYYVGHKGKFGHEFLEFEFRPDGKQKELFTNYFYRDDVYNLVYRLSNLIIF